VRPILNEPLGETHVVGAVFEPGGVAAFLDGPVETIANRILPLGDVASSLGSGRTLLAALEPSRGPASAIEIIGRELAARLTPPDDYERWRGAAEALANPEVRTVAEVQRSVETSRRHFAAQMRRLVGLNPKSVQRIARWRRLLEDLDARRPIRWSFEAVGAGYFDQPHAIRDFQEFAGMTPVEYVNRRRQAWGHEIEPGEAANFVPEIIR
jgi:AraC-like DNA-binding protein